MTEKQCASRAELAGKQITFERLSEHAYAYTAESDPNPDIAGGDATQYPDSRVWTGRRDKAMWQTLEG